MKTQKRLIPSTCSSEMIAFIFRRKYAKWLCLELSDFGGYQCRRQKGHQNRHWAPMISEKTGLMGGWVEWGPPPEDPAS